MERHNYDFLLIFSIVAIALGLVSSSMCIAAEFKRSKKKDLRINGKLCYLAGSHSFGFGIVALICLFVGHIIANVTVFRNFCFGGQRSSCKAKKPPIGIIFLVTSWISFGIAVILIGAATSMNRRQPFGEGWLDGECYIVKDGVYIASAILVLITIGSPLISTFITINKRQHVQLEREHTQNY